MGALKWHYLHTDFPIIRSIAMLNISFCGWIRQWGDIKVHLYGFDGNLLIRNSNKRATVVYAQNLNVVFVAF